MGGRRALFRGREISGRKQPDDKLALYREAVRLDPDFALAWMRMGDLQMASRRLEEGVASWAKARSVMQRRQLTKREEYRIRGLYANDTRDYEEAERVYRLWLMAYPNDPLPFYIARPLMMLGRTKEALQMMEAARERERDAHYILVNLALLHLRAGNLDATREPIAALRGIGENGWANYIQGQLDFLRGDRAARCARFDALKRGSDAELAPRAPSLQAAALADSGRTEEALVRLERGIKADMSAGRHVEQADKLLHAATLELALGRSRACRDRCVLIEQIDQSAERLTEVAGLFARAGFPAEAERLMRGLAANESTRGLEAARARVRGEVLLARGQARQAWVSFQRAATLDPPGSRTSISRVARSRPAKPARHARSTNAWPPTSATTGTLPISSQMGHGSPPAVSSRASRTVRQPQRAEEASKGTPCHSTPCTTGRRSPSSWLSCATGICSRLSTGRIPRTRHSTRRPSRSTFRPGSSVRTSRRP